MAQRRGDVETQKRALETVCHLYEIDPTKLTRQGLGARGGKFRTRQAGGDGDEVAMATPPPTPLPPEHHQTTTRTNHDIVEDAQDAQSDEKVINDIDRFLDGDQ